MADLLATIEGTFILSLNDHPDVRSIFAAFHLEEVETTYHLSGMGRTKRVVELIITPRCNGI